MLSPLHPTFSQNFAMQSAVPARAIAVAPMPSEISNSMGVSAPNFSYGVAVPQFFQTPITFAAPGAGGSHVRGVSSSRSGVCASRHMAAEQRRRARINERLEALRGLVPHSARANTAAFLTEVYDYINALHKRLHGLGGSLIDLNIEATEVKDKGEINGAGVISKGAFSHNRKRARSSKSDDESEVETESEGNTSGDSNAAAEDNKGHLNTVLAPSLFEHVPKSTLENGAILALSPYSEVQHTMSKSNSMENPSGVTISDAAPTASFGTDTSLSMSQPMSLTPPTSLSQPGQGSAFSNRLGGKICSTQMTLGVNTAVVGAQLPPSKPWLCEVQPSVVPILPQLHTNSVAAASAAAAEAAAAAQSWNMAAAVAQAQAHVAAQVHAQAQAQMHAAQAQAQAQAQIQAANNVTPQKKRRRASGAESCGARFRNGQAVVRPIALKPQR